ncbi:type II secretion system F family protein [Cohnella algarum]|uniref:type II secretion system F family protein n=1 Tax=Cohnella algarum TaxID=2044859 RepID=UPI00196751F3|nr:type II secretion system F family protein [Cohnella algarum]MBN2980068.1 type II secretion system F family protein [Cohnella algarum]
MTDYRIYVLSRKQRLAAIGAGSLFGFGAAWMLYGNPYVALAAALCGMGGPRLLREQLRRQRLDKLRRHFKEALGALSALLSAGRSVENAFSVLEQDVAMLIGDPNADLLREIRAIVIRFRNGEPFEAGLADFAERSGLEEVRNFAEAFQICKRAGGNLVEVVRRTAGLIGEKMEVEQEVTVLIAQKKLESKLMMAMPFGFVFLLQVIASDYMSALRQGIGWVVLTACLSLLGLISWWMARLMDIRI